MDCDVVLNGITGAVGLRPTLAALDAGNTLALANKESLIVGGPLVVERAKPGQIVPVDSEHSALAQCLRGGSPEEVRRLVLTASGGPFRGRSVEELHDVTVDEALAHPTWDMGPVVTINSATLVNKGLEVIEAHLLFGVPIDRIEVVVHPTSVVHSMVEFVDGATLVQASPPTMLIPIALGLNWPDRVPDTAPAVDWTRPETWEFFPLDDDAFPAVALAKRAATMGGTAPAVYNAANEVCVEAFRQGRLAFTQIVPTVSSVLARHDVPLTPGTSLTVEDVLAADAWARAEAASGWRVRAGPRGDQRVSSLYYTLGVVIFFAAILISIGLHELGHMIPAKAFGGKVTQYFIGFGPTVWSRKRGETEYGVKAIPLGGYVKIVGMLPPGAEQLGKVTYDDQGNQVTKIRKSNTGLFTQLISDARAAEWELITPADEDRLFYKMPWWKKVVVMAGGPSVNIGIAFFLFWGVFATFGNPRRRGARLRRTHDLHGLRLRDPGEGEPHDLPAGRPGQPGCRGRPEARRRDHQVQPDAGDELGPASLADPRQRRRQRASRLGARRHHDVRLHQHHRRAAARPRRRPDAARGRLPRGHADHSLRHRRAALHDRADGLHRRADRGGDDPAARAGLGRGQGDRGRPGARPGEPGQHRRRQPARGGDGVAARPPDRAQGRLSD